MNGLHRIRGNIPFNGKSFLQQLRYFSRNLEPYKLNIPKIEKRLDVVLFGLPNVGKSVLLNSMIKYKLAAISRKRQTTRGEILGVFNYRNTQLAFYDTPGYISRHDGGKSKESHILIQTAVDTLEKADVVLLMVDASRPLTHNAKFLFAEMVKIALQNLKKELILVLNKVDLVHPKTKLLDITHQLVSLINGVRLGEEKKHLAQLDTTTFMISGLKDDGVLDLKNYLIRIADKKPWLLKEQLSSLSLEEKLEQILLEKILEYLHDEIPYHMDMKCTDIDYSDENHIKVQMSLFFENERHKRRFIGSQGETLIRIRQDFLSEAESLFKNKKLFVVFDMKLEK